MSRIASVKGHRKDPSPLGPIGLCVLGVFAILAGKIRIMAALLLVGGAISWWIVQKPVYSVSVVGSSSETTALSSADRNLITSIIGAVNDAIQHRNARPP